MLSGTLNYVFNTISAEVSFSQAVKKAQEEGYSEPDPRVDLSGIDVVRKLTILARESGYRVESSDIVTERFLPEALFDSTLEDFWTQLPTLDAHFEKERQRLARENKCWRFVAEWHEGKGKVGLKEVSQEHPLYHLEGSNNILCLTTERYDHSWLWCRSSRHRRWRLCRCDAHSSPLIPRVMKCGYPSTMISISFICPHENVSFDVDILLGESPSFA